jgi:hypothetical protein
MKLGETIMGPRHELVGEFWRMMQNVNDDATGLKDCLDFLHQLMRVKDFVPPVVEVVAVIRVEKPLIYHMLKSRVPKTSPVSMVLQLDMDYKEAKRRLQPFFEMSEESS